MKMSGFLTVIAALLAASTIVLVTASEIEAAVPCPPDLDQSQQPQPTCGIQAPSSIQGYGAITTGGAGGEVCRVTNLDDAGAGSFRDCLLNRNSSGGSYVPRTVLFDVGGTIRLQSEISLKRSPYLTIDGASAPAPGITIKKITEEIGEVLLNTSGADSAHDIIITNLRFDGEWSGSEDTSNNSATLTLDGEENPGGVYNIVLDHMVFANGSDGAPDMWGEVRNITVSWSIFMGNLHPMTISHSGGIQVRQNISIHHNVFAYSHERNPQIRGNVRNLDYVNNIVYRWGIFPGGGYGIRLRDRAGVYATDINVIDNFFHSINRPESAIILSSDPGIPYPGSVYINGNLLPPETTVASTRNNPVPVPSYAVVDKFNVDALVDKVLPNIGTKYLLPEEEALLQEIATQMQADLSN